jgi:N-acetylneuraminic acid mutarotase
VHHRTRSSPSSRHRAAVSSKAIARPARLVYHSLYDLAAPVKDPASAALGSRTFVLLGGIDAADTSSDEVIVAGLHGSSVKATLPNAQHDAQAATLGRRVYVFGGGQFTQYDHILAFDGATGAVTVAGILPSAASDVAVTGDGRTAYVVGGFDGVNWLNTVLAYAPGGPVRVVAHLPVALRYAAAAMVGGDVIIAGGSTEMGVSNAIYKVDPTTHAVTILGHLPTGLTHAGAGVLDGTMYLVGGRGDLDTDRTARVLAIDPATGKVTRAGRLPQPLSDAAVVTLPGALIVAGGATAGGTQAPVGELAPAGP